MNDSKPKRKWSFLILITTLFLMLSPSQVASQKNEQLRELKDEKVTKSLSTSENASNEVVVRKVQVFHNKNGFKDEILIEGPLRELNAISKTKEESIEDLIEHASVWIPKMYCEIFFLVKPRCIIILETKINEEEKAEVRFGVAMKCTIDPQILKIINI